MALTEQKRALRTTETTPAVTLVLYHVRMSPSSVRFGVRETSLGLMLVGMTERGVCAILLGDDRMALERELSRRFPNAAISEGGPDLARSIADVVNFVENSDSPWTIPLDVTGTEFQRRVWNVLAEIPSGSTATYSEVAMRIGAKDARRAVAQACGANPVAIAIPCHRVVRSDGSLGGYRWGLERKRTLLAREKGS